MTYKTEHYIFHCVNNKTAEKDIEIIAKMQEESYAIITTELKVKYESIINYYLVNTPEVVAELTRYPFPVNGLACFSDRSVYAVYSDKIKCIGPHEDAHLISEKFGIPKSDFLCEGLAMHFDKRWWGIENELWCKYFIKTGIFIEPTKLLKNQEFYKVDCSISYPIAGAFTSYVIKKSGIEKYKYFYLLKSVNAEDYKELQSLSNKFVKEVKRITLNDVETERIRTVYTSNIE